MSSLKLKNISKRYYGGITAVHDFNLDIQDREFIVLVGPSGCGKTTALRMIAGLEEISEGELYIGDRLVNDVEAKDRDIAMVFQNCALYPDKAVFDNMAFGLKLRNTPENEIIRRVNEAAEILDIKQLLDRAPKELSDGQRQRVALGRAIVREPKVFLMDEPLSNLDSKLRLQMRTEISKLHQKLQATIIYVTHDQTEAMAMGTRIVVMKDGCIQQVDTPQALYERPCNVFVAGFIGSLPMNMINSKLIKRGNEIHLLFGRHDIILPEGKSKKLEGTEYIGKEVILGFRPESIHDEAVFLECMPESVIDAVVEVTEMLGSETYLHMSVDGANSMVTARVNPRTRVKAGDTVKVAIDVNKVHLFDKETERTILN